MAGTGRKPTGTPPARAGAPAGLASPAERAAHGRSLRTATPRSSHAVWEPPADRPDPIALLEEQAADRLPELVPIRHGRMSQSPFTFYRGAAYVMASDLAATPRTGITVQLCGDAHLVNFGGFASAERQLLFDLNDFDETLPGPWEWDVKRLAASVAVAGRENGFAPDRRTVIVGQAVAEYRRAMREFAGMKTLDVWYARASISDVRRLLAPESTARQRQEFKRTLEKGRRKDSARAFAKLAVTDGGEARIAADPPLLVPLEDFIGDSDGRKLERRARALLTSYLASLPADRHRLLERYRYVDMARKVVGVGSVGTRCWVILLFGRDTSDPLFLQVKEAQRSVLERFTGRSTFENQGQRVVEGQRLMQAAGDIFLGWLHEPHALDDGQPRDFYVRQLWDAKTSADVLRMRPADMGLYARLCAWTLARAHARSGDAVAIAGYLGTGNTFNRAITTFAECYAEQNERDHAALLAAIASGQLRAAG